MPCGSSFAPESDSTERARTHLDPDAVVHIDIVAHECDGLSLGPGPHDDDRGGHVREGTHLDISTVDDPLRGDPDVFGPKWRTSVGSIGGVATFDEPDGLDGRL